MGLVLAAGAGEWGGWRRAWEERSGPHVATQQSSLPHLCAADEDAADADATNNPGLPGRVVLPTEAGRIVQISAGGCSSLPPPLPPSLPPFLTSLRSTLRFASFRFGTRPTRVLHSVHASGSRGSQPAGFREEAQPLGAPDAQFPTSALLRPLRSLPLPRPPLPSCPAGDAHTCVLTELGAVWGWGTYRDGGGVMGFSPDVRIQHTPVPIYSPKRKEDQVQRIASGGCRRGRMHCTHFSLRRCTFL